MKLATIETISEIRPHSNADRLELAKVLGWQAVVKKGEFKAGDRVCFVVIDTILPRTPWSGFLVDPKKPDAPIRLRTVKLRGEYSQGLVLPLSVLPEHVRSWQNGADIGGELGIKKYEKELPLALSGVVKGSFPQHIVSKTDEDNGLSNPSLVEYVLDYDHLTITQKLDGSSCTVIIINGQISEVCSRNLSLVESDANAFWVAAKKIDTRNVADIIIQAELMGPGVQGNQLGLTSPELFVFNMGTGGGWLSYMEMCSLCKHMNLSVVPIIEQNHRHTLDTLQALADVQVLPSGKPAEGIVIRPSSYPSSGIGRPLGFKIINRNYGE